MSISPKSAFLDSDSSDAENVPTPQSRFPSNNHQFGAQIQAQVPVQRQPPSAYPENLTTNFAQTSSMQNPQHRSVAAPVAPMNNQMSAFHSMPQFDRQYTAQAPVQQPFAAFPMKGMPNFAQNQPNFQPSPIPPPSSPQMPPFPSVDPQMMAYMQDPNFMQQMMHFMQQMQLQQQMSQQNGATSENAPPSYYSAPTGTEKPRSSKKMPQVSPAVNQYSGPRKAIHILVLGETGVGKSTWINGIANYMSFDNIVDALEAPEPICVIPSKFTMCDENYEQREIVIGSSTNKVFGKGQSATQDARTYLFTTPKYDVYIIDTPGIGDVRGIDQDKENTRKILNAIAPYKDLHAICLLFKSNDARMTLGFRYCIGELLLQLHKDAAKNIVFFFTNARGTFYKPGDTIVPLRAFLEELNQKQGIQVALNRRNIFFLDNEAFKFVCAHHDGVEFSEEDMLNFGSSWKKSAEETHRFLDYAAECKPHSVDKTLSVNQARGIILQLAKPLADINDLIETNIKVYNDRKSEIENTKATIDDLQKKLLIMHSRLAMQGGQQCHVCGCNWSTHMHIRFKQVKTNELVEDVNIKNAIQTNEDARITKQKIIESCEKIVDEYKAEQKTIMDASIRFAVFLKQNAILTYNDVFEKYVEKSIEEEEKCIKAGGDHTKLNNLKQFLAEYRQERAAIEHALQIGGNGRQQQITTDDVKNMKSILFALPHFGAKLKELFNRTVQGYATNQQQSVQKFAPPTSNQSAGKKKSSGVLAKTRGALQRKS